MPTVVSSNTTIEYFDGFDDYSSSQINRYWTGAISHGNPYTVSAIPGNVTIDAANGRNGSSAVKFSGSSCGLFLAPVTGSVATRTIGIAVKLVSMDAQNPFLISFYDSAVPQVGLLINVDSTLSVYRPATSGGLGTLLVGPSAQTLSFGVYYYIEMSAKVNGSSGTVTVRVNGVQWLNGTSLNTQNTANSTCNGISVGIVRGTGTTLYLDDFYVRSDGIIMGDQRVESRLANANGATDAWVASTGSNFSCVNENPPTDDTNYVSSANVGDVDLYAYPNLATTAGAVNAVMVNGVARVDTAGTATACAVYRSSGGTVYPSSNIQSIGATTYNAYVDIQGQDPSTSAPWTVAGVNGFQYGVKRLS